MCRQVSRWRESSNQWMLPSLFVGVLSEMLALCGWDGELDRLQKQQSPPITVSVLSTIGFAAPSIKSPIFHLLERGLPCDLLWPIAWNRSDASVPELRVQSSCTLPLTLLKPAQTLCQEAQTSLTRSRRPHCPSPEPTKCQTWEWGYPRPASSQPTCQLTTNAWATLARPETIQLTSRLTSYNKCLLF